MQGGFTFCGVDIGEFGLEYAPEIKDTYVYRPAETTIHEESFEGHDGGYLYGGWKEPKEFILRCIFEKRIDRGLLASVYNLFRIGRSGKLVFQRRPWVYYYATVTSVSDEDLLSYRSGIINITMKAMYPFGRCDDFTCTRYTEHYSEVMQNTALFNMDGMVPTMAFDTSNMPRPYKSILLANPGTERAAVSIAIAGDVGAGVTIRNISTGQSCSFVGITSSNTTDLNKWVHVDGINGKTTVGNKYDRKLGFIYHRAGFLELEPAFPAIREVYETHSNNEIRTTGRIYDNVEGRYIYINSDWHYIREQPDEQTLILSDNVGNGEGKTTIMRMNEIMIIPDDTVNLTKLEFIYKPTFA